MKCDWMLYNDKNYHILTGEMRTGTPTYIHRKVLCAKTKIVPLGIYKNFEEDELPLPATVCIDCKCMRTMLELAE